jgi:protein O-GlcNAc transferase
MKSNAAALAIPSPSFCQPSIPAEGLAILRECLARTTTLLEYGSGASTMMAGAVGVERVYTVESDRAFLGSVTEAFLRRHRASQLFGIWADVGPTGSWGMPTDPAAAGKFARYSVAGWDMLARNHHQPELVLVDGCFRVATMLVSLVHASRGTTILFDDYFDHPAYHVVERHCAVASRHGTMARFVVGDPPAPTALLRDVLTHCGNPA